MLIFKAQNKFSRSHTISYQSLLLSITVLNDIQAMYYFHTSDQREMPVYITDIALAVEC